MEWRSICDKLADLIGGFGASIDPANPHQRGPWCVHSRSLRENVEEYFRENWSELDPRPRSFEVARRNGFATDLDIVSPDIIRSHPYYTDFLRRRRLGHFVGIHLRVDQKDWMISVQRPEGAGEPSNELIEHIPRLRRVIMGHASRAFAIGATKLENWIKGFDEADRGIAIIRRDGKVARLNAEAERLLAVSGLLRGNEIVSPDKIAGLQLKDMLAKVTQMDTTEEYSPPIVYSLGDRTLVLDVFRLPRTLRQFFLSGAAVLVVRSASKQVMDVAASLVQQFGLSSTEAEIAMGIAEGKTLRSLSEQLALKEGSVRQYLKIAMAKTNTHKQTQLVALMKDIEKR
ncbi:helix-turn-helix transcriptional regulator [Mesorhizobium sp. LHD-90]|uniref:helix-turn-helix transcriptional regulator n=1 Tax=Mesorhizobium sp. LHD-90 TaxID=3071414 RepID=UPI0027E09552|nr:helix-turn-helix transcriptional regulator [Mesorhizobium sp. LHD-90]MDQ6434368.1 helix-turn-helix transcriptional regulator [Mesorhizobium sp. LHD-90]